ncbi:MAG: transcription termination factor Rho [Opitutales bacterium]|nr:transcription termination factor Rho [Opitutales bacterium]
MFDKSNDTHIPEEVPALQQSKTEEKQEIKVESQSVFTEDYTFTVANCGEISCLENFNEIYPKSLKEIQETLVEMGMENRLGLNKNALIKEFYNLAFAQKKLVKISGILDVFENNYGGAIVFDCDNYRLRKYCVYIPKIFIDKYSLARGHKLTVLAAPPKSEDSCPFAVKICSVMDDNPDEIKNVVAFNDLVPYYPTERIIMENANNNAHSNISMRAVDLLAPIGLGQRALIVAPPRTGKTVLMQSMAQSIRKNKPNAHLIVLLVDERPEEVTDFKRSVDAEVIASTFDEEAQNHVHAAEMVISYARRMVEAGKDVIILLDSITRLARAYNALMPNGGRTMSGGVEANALQKPKKFFGSARNIEGGGSLTIIGTALVETGSKMDEVIFEEFKGTGNLELHLDRMLSDKRIFPAINMEKTGTRKEELLYHPDELDKIYALRKAMHGVPIVDSMEMLLKRLKNTKTNVEFLLGLNR